MKKLTIEHLAPYLPYKLCIVDNSRKKTMNASQGSSGNWISIKKVIDWQCKPILRNLFDLTKEIEMNGEKFISLDELKKVDGEYFINFEAGEIYFEDECGLSVYEVTRCNKLINKLFEWHFDIFGLINDGLAIDINTL